MDTQLQTLLQMLEPDSLQPGSAGVEVVSLQLALRALACFEGKVDGHFGTKTSSALQQLQRDFGLPETGQLDAATWYALTFWAEPDSPQSSTVNSPKSTSCNWIPWPIMRLAS